MKDDPRFDRATDVVPSDPPGCEPHEVWYERVAELYGPAVLSWIRRVLDHGHDPD